MYFNVSTGYAMALGEIIQAYLAHDDWQPTTNLNGVPMLVSRSFVSPESQARIQEMEAKSQEIKAELDAIYRASAPFLVLVMNADGVVTDAELEAVRQIDADCDEIHIEGDDAVSEYSNAVAAVLDGRGMDLADARTALFKFPPGVRKRLLELCERIADAEGGSWRSRGSIGDPSLAVPANDEQQSAQSGSGVPSERGSLRAWGLLLSLRTRSSPSG
jgi:uncharacterized tellurite resistance protein B-like protein